MLLSFYTIQMNKLISDRLWVKGLLLILLVCTGVRSEAQGNEENKSKIFEDYKAHKSNSVLPDFSYVGYHSGEEAVPTINNYKVFNVTDFGAIPDDTISDKAAIQSAISAANLNGSGIVFFPKGRFLVNEDVDQLTSILSKGSKIIFRGSGSGPGGTELFMKNCLPPANPDQMWSVPPLFIFTSGGADKKMGTVTNVAPVGSFELKLNDAKSLVAGDWIVLRMLNNDPALIKAELNPHDADKTWTYLVQKGVDLKIYHQIKKIEGDVVTLNTPITYNIDPKYNWEIYKFAHSEEVGIEDIAFVGNWKEKFIHHRSWKDDSGWTLFRFSRCVNSWMRNCRFTDCNVGAVVAQSANISIINCKITGNGGHEAICNNGSTNILFAKLTDEASMFHSFGSSHGAMNTVLWRCVYPSTTCFESHSSQPRNTLLDCVEGGLMQNRGGGSIENMPNHMQGLVMWNYHQTNKAINEFEFWPAGYEYWKIPNPVIVGFTSSGTTFNKQQTGYLESIGKFVTPYSLYEAQLNLRLKKKSDWLEKLQRIN